MSASGGDHAGGLGHVIAGACLALTLFGLVVIVTSLFHVEVIPHSNGSTGLLMLGLLALGAGAGAVAGRRTPARR